jgi:anti-sigma factor RsiW
VTGCERALDAMSERMDNALAAKDCAELKRHLASCAACRSREAGIAELRGLLRRLEDVSSRPAETVALNVRAAVEGTDGPETVAVPARAPGRRSMMLPALLGTSLGLILAIPIALPSSSCVTGPGVPRPARRRRWSLPRLSRPRANRLRSSGIQSVRKSFLPRPNPRRKRLLCGNPRSRNRPP